MVYPKLIMTMTELIALGFPRGYLEKAVHSKGQDFASRTSPRGKYLFDTKKFEEYRERERLLQRGGAR